MNENTYYVGIESKGHTCKPEGRKFAGIKRDTLNNYGSYDLESIVYSVGEKGHAILPSYLKDGMKQENFRSIQIFMLDFD